MRTVVDRNVVMRLILVFTYRQHREVVLGVKFLRGHRRITEKKGGHSNFLVGHLNFTPQINQAQRGALTKKWGRGGFINKGVEKCRYDDLVASEKRLPDGRCHIHKNGKQKVRYRRTGIGKHASSVRWLNVYYSGLRFPSTFCTLPSLRFSHT